MKTLLSVAAIVGFLGVLLGAFGAHALKDRLGPDMIAIWHTGTEYHLVHAVMAALCGAAGCFVESKKLTMAGWFFLAGVLIFSGSLYAYAITGIIGLAIITPLGGLSFMVGWVVLAFAANDFPSPSKSQ